MKPLKISSVSSGEAGRDLCFINLLKPENEISKTKLIQESYRGVLSGTSEDSHLIDDVPRIASPNLHLPHSPISQEDVHPRSNLLPQDVTRTSKGWLDDVKTPFLDITLDTCPDGSSESQGESLDEKRKDLEEKLLSIQKMEAIGTLAGGIAHDFNNILMGIQGYISVILYDLKPDHPYRIKFENIENYLKMGSDLTKQLLNFAQGEKYEAAAADVNELIDKSGDMFGRTRKEISIYKHLKKQLWAVNVDRGQLNQVFLNLFINASQAMPEGGNLTIETDNVVLGENEIRPASLEAGRYVRIVIIDDGIGMDNKTLKRIFEPFFTTKPKGIGTGLGLTSSYGIIKSHGGAIEVESEPGKGTRFRIYLPATTAAPAAQEQRQEDVLTGTETILIVDDEKINIAVMKEMLEMLDYHVFCAGSGQEALAVFMEKQNEIDLVVLDMILPGMSGSQTFEALRQINPQIPVILASGYNAKGEAQKILDKGCNGFIQKPFHLQDLSQKIRDILDGVK